MNSEWIEAEKAKCAATAQARRAKLVAQITSSELLTDEDKRTTVEALDKETSYGMFSIYAMLAIFDNHGKDGDKPFPSMGIEKFLRNLKTDEYDSAAYKAGGGLERYLDSEPMEFDGDIIITDPCYIIRAEHHGTKPITDDDWGACGYGENMEALGIHRYMTRDTLYGDWSCAVFNTDTEKAIGEFCADAGLVSVFLLDEVLKYNPDFNYHKERTWTTTLIPDFKGTVQFVVEHEEGLYTVVHATKMRYDESRNNGGNNGSSR